MSQCFATSCTLKVPFGREGGFQPTALGEDRRGAAAAESSGLVALASNANVLEHLLTFLGADDILHGMVSHMQHLGGLCGKEFTSHAENHGVGLFDARRPGADLALKEPRNTQAGDIRIAIG